MQSNKRWASLHIFYWGDINNLVTECLQREIRAGAEMGEIEAWFFIRYWNGGPHVRLRVLTSHAYERKLICAIQAFMSASPGLPWSKAQYEANAERTVAAGATLERRLEFSGLKQEQVESFHAHDCIEVRPYSFDSVRYGGLEAQYIVERHFYRASEIAMIALTRYRREDVLSVALELLTACAFCSFKSDQDAERLIEAAIRAYPLFFEEDIPLQVVDVVDDEELDSQVRGLVNRWKNRTSDTKTTTPVLAVLWAEEIAFVSMKIDEHRITHSGEYSRELLILEFLHLMWNRLGITLAEEWYLYKLIGSAIDPIG